MGGFDGVDVDAASKKYRGGHDHHGRIDEPRAIHGQQDIEEFHLAVMMLFTIVRFTARKDERGM